MQQIRLSSWDLIIYSLFSIDSSILSIAVDYITDNVYFTSNQSLSVCSKKGEICVQMKCCNVSYVALAPKFRWVFVSISEQITYLGVYLGHCLLTRTLDPNRWMFYVKASDLPNENFIMKSNMDGSNENVLIDGTLRGVTAIAVDESFSRLYWLDHTSRIIVQSISLHDYRMEVSFITIGSSNVCGCIFISNT